MTRIRGAAAHGIAAAAFILSTFVPAFGLVRADQPDHQSVGLDSDIGGAVVLTDQTYDLPYVHSLIGVFCRGKINQADQLVGILVQPDLFKSGAKSLKIQQKAYVYMQADVSEFESGTPIVDTALLPIAGCAASIALKDGDADLDYDAGTDSLKASLSCGSDLPSAFGLDTTQTAAFVSAFGEEPACKITGIPNSSVCFRGDTMVSTETGLRPIRDLKVGDRVWSVEETSGKEVLQPITKTYRRSGSALRSVDIGAETIRTTDQHPFRVDGKGWVKAKDLVAGDRIVAHGGSDVAVASNRSVDAQEFYAGYVAGGEIRRASVGIDSLLTRPDYFAKPGVVGPPSPQDSALSPMVYNIEVGGLHNYLIGTQRVLVHNK